MGEVRHNDKVTLRRPETPKEHKERIIHCEEASTVRFPYATTNKTSESELQFDFLLASKWEASQK